MFHFVEPLFDDISTILPEQLYLGNETAAQSEDILQEHRITHVIQIRARDQQEDIAEQELNSRTYLKLFLDDSPSDDIRPLFETCHNFIRNAIEKENGIVLVHCAMGVSRSATIVIAYLMKHLQINENLALMMVQRVRPLVNPNEGFMKALHDYGKEL